MAIRYPGSKWKLSKWIVPYVPPDVRYYHEPFCGLGYVFKRVRLRVPMITMYHLSDLNPLVSNFHLAVQGDRDVTRLYGDIIERVRLARRRLLPESAHETEIREEFNRSRNRLRFEDDPYAWMVVQMYARGQYCGRHRADIASFDPSFFGHGFTAMTIERLTQWRSLLADADVRCEDALSVLRRLNTCSDAELRFCYLDPPYLSADPRGYSFKMYQHELTLQQHLELNAILRTAKFRFALSLADAPLVRQCYIEDETFQSPFRQHPGFHAVLLSPANSRRRRSLLRTGPSRRIEWLVMNFDPV